MDWRVSTRPIRHAWQRATRGYDDSALWSLDNYIADIAIPVLKRWIAGERMGYFYTDEMWKKYGSCDAIPNGEAEESCNQVLRDIVYALELVNEGSINPTRKEIRAKAKGLRLFAKYFEHLWD